ncbi:unnamed protein product [Durusdinium trenchii]|uniref:Uncharacterized protein n=1 Tax=Durusdinium trenchii TaxID=1381693 RepID=A0ABP0MVL3_9DINO
MGSVLLFLSCVVLAVSKATRTAFELLDEEENDLVQRRQDFDDWCKKELSNQEKLRQELLQLQEDSEIEIPGEFEVPGKLLEIARQLKPNPPELKMADLTVKTLRAVETDLARSQTLFFGETRGMHALQKLLREASDRMKGLSLGDTSRASLTVQLETLKAEQKSASEQLAARHAKSIALRSGRKVLGTALAQTRASLVEAAGLCGLGRTVLNRSESTGKMLSRKALELIGMVEGSADATGSSSREPGTKPLVEQSTELPRKQAENLDVQAVSGPLLALSRQLQLQQQHIQDQLDELKQMKRQELAPVIPVVPSMPMATAATEVASQAPKMQESGQLDSNEPLASSKPRLKHAKVPLASLALATENVAAKEAASGSSSAGTILTPKTESKVAEDPTLLQAPKDFPAALRGGWQALLAQKRVESRKKPARGEESSSIMELMQTPKTYTAWQPDSGPSQPAGKAKEDLLAAERAFDEEDDADKGGGKKKSSRSFLQLHDKDLGDSMDDLGGRDPLAFFQLGDLTGIPPFAAPRAQSEVALLLGKFAEFTNSSTLFELSRSQLQKQDFDILLQTEPEEDRSLQFCNSLVLHQSNDLEADVTAELQKHYAETKARLEGQALRHEVSAREHLVSAFTNTSQRFTTLQQLLERSFEHEETRLHGLEQQLIQLESTKSAHTTAEELHSILTSLVTTMRESREKLEDALGAATTRQQQAEDVDQQGLKKLQADLRKLEEPLHHARPNPLEKICGLAKESFAKRQEKQRMEIVALRTAKALDDELA